MGTQYNRKSVTNYYSIANIARIRTHSAKKFELTGGTRSSSPPADSVYVTDTGPPQRQSGRHHGVFVSGVSQRDCAG